MLRQREKGLLVVAAILRFTVAGWSQAIFATLTGVVTDPTGAVVPQAKITPRNVPAGDIRNTTADQQRHYTFASVPVGTYNLTQAGFQTFRDNAMPLGGGEFRSVSVSLQLGNTSQTANVSGEADTLAPVDSG
jgi:Carboxypeptidase regulatory-like domain